MDYTQHIIRFDKIERYKTRYFYNGKRLFPKDILINKIYMKMFNRSINSDEILTDLPEYVYPFIYKACLRSHNRYYDSFYYYKKRGYKPKRLYDHTRECWLWDESHLLDFVYKKFNSNKRRLKTAMMSMTRFHVYIPPEVIDIIGKNVKQEFENGSVYYENQISVHDSEIKKLHQQINKLRLEIEDREEDIADSRFFMNL